MPRSRPSAIRAHLSRRADDTRPVPRRTVVPGVGTATAAAILRWESTHPYLAVGSVARALSVWSRLAQGPLRRLIDELKPACCPCCAQGPEQRDILQAALVGVPARHARDLRRLVDSMDDLVVRRTVAVPDTPLGLPWWYGRC
jgi:hypothetical protein